MRAGRNILAIAPLDSVSGGSQGFRNCESSTDGKGRALAVEKLQLFHRDPFDRMLIAQAIMGGLATVTSDRAFEPYPVRVIW